MRSDTAGTEQADLAAIHRRQDRAIAETPDYPAHRFSGRGIVMLAGGGTYFTGAYLNLVMLRRHLACRLPVEVWYLDEREMSPVMRRILESLDATCIDVNTVKSQYPYPPVTGWQNKIYSIMNSRFREVIFIDADNIPLCDPEQLFQHPGYRATGALFWPDIRWNDPASRIWELCRVPYYDGPEWCSAQMLIDKQRTWRTLWLTRHLNEEAETYYQHILGDKGTFQMAWHMLDKPYHLIQEPPLECIRFLDEPDPIGHTWTNELIQYINNDQPVFAHQTSGKITAFGRRPPYSLEWLNEAVAAALAELREQWDGRVRHYIHVEIPDDRDAIVRTRYFAYVRIGCSERVISLHDDGRIAGAGAYEQWWSLEKHQFWSVISIYRDATVITARLRRCPDGAWRGCWRYAERMPVELIPIGEPPDSPVFERDGELRT